MPNFPPVPGQPAAVSSCGVREGIFSALGTHSARRGGYSEPDPVPAAGQPKQGPGGVCETQRGRSCAAHWGGPQSTTPANTGRRGALQPPIWGHSTLLPPSPAPRTPPTHRDTGVWAQTCPWSPQILCPRCPPLHAARHQQQGPLPQAALGHHGGSHPTKGVAPTRPPRGPPQPCRGPHLTAGPAAGFPVGRAGLRVVGEARGGAGTAGLIGPP